MGLNDELNELIDQAALVELGNHPQLRAFAGVGALAWEAVDAGWPDERLGRAVAAAVARWKARCVPELQAAPVDLVIPLLERNQADDEAG